MKQYYSLVFGVAWRSTQSRSLAEDVTQEVFITLAQKAKGIREPEKLVGWLHRTTTLCAMNVNRKEARRKRAMRSYSEELSGAMFSSPEEEASWQKALPLLDTLIEELPSSDRQAILLRFYEERGFKAIGEILGKSEEACRKKVSRAVEKLSALLRKRRVVVGSPVLLSTLSASLKAESLSRGTSYSELARLAVEAKVASGLGVTTQVLSVMSGYKITFVAASLLALVPPSLQWQENRVVESSPRPFAAEFLSDDTRFQQKNLRNRATKDLPRSQEELLRELSLISQLSFSFEREAEAEHLVLSLKKEELPLMLAVFQGDFPRMKLSGGLKNALWNKLFVRWVRVDSDAAIEVAKTLQDFEQGSTVYGGIVEGLAWRDPERAKEFLDSLPEDEIGENLRRLRWSYHVREDPEEALQMALEIEDPNERVSIMDKVLRVVEQIDPSLGLSYVEGEEDGIDKERWLKSLVEELASKQPQEAFAYLVESSDQKLALSALPKVMGHWARHDLKGSFQALSVLGKEKRSNSIFKSYGYGLENVEKAKWVFQQLKDEGERSALLSGISSAYESQATYFNPPSSKELTHLRELVESLPDGVDRREAEWDFGGLWARMSSAEANDWIQQSLSMDEKMKEKFTRYFHEID